MDAEGYCYGEWADAAHETPGLSYARRQFQYNHRCHAFCRGDTHAEVLFAHPDMTNVEDDLRSLCAGLGLAFRHCEPAPEARWPEGLPAHAFHYGGEEVRSNARPQRGNAWLLVFEV